MEVSSFNDIDITNVKLILLDLDNTLYSYRLSHLKALEVVGAWFKSNLSIDFVDFEIHYMNARKKVHTMHKHTAAGHSRFFYFQFMFENILGRTDFEATVTCNSLYWDTFIENMTLYEDASVFLKQCKANDIAICMVTDMLAEIQFNKIKHLKIEGNIKYIVSSEEAGVEKPDPYIFNYAIQKSKQVLRSDDYIAVIGDNPKADVFQSIDFNLKHYLIVRDE